MMKSATGVDVVLEDVSGVRSTVSFDRMLVVIGRTPNTDAIGRFYRDVYYHEPTLAHLESLFQSRLRTGLRVFDLNETAPAIRDRVAEMPADEPLVMGGRSMGGRMCSMIAAGRACA